MAGLSGQGGGLQVGSCPRGVGLWFVRLGEGADLGHGGVTEEAAAALRTDQLRVSSRLCGWEGIDDDVLDPIGVVTGTATVSGPFPRSVPGHFLKHLLQPIGLLVLWIRLVQ